MTAAAALAHARAAGLTLSAGGDRLRWRGPQPPAELLAELRQHKPGLLALLAAGSGHDGLSANPTHAPPLPPASPEQAEAERQDRAAIAEVDGGADPAPETRARGHNGMGGADPAGWRLADHMRHAAVLRGLQAAALARPPSWPDPDALPSAGCWCACCRGSRWWREREAPSGWRCRTCHPPVPGMAVAEVRT